MDSELRAELLRRAEQDQAARLGVIAGTAVIPCRRGGVASDLWS